MMAGDTLLADAWSLRLFPNASSENPYVWEEVEVADGPADPDPPPARKGHTALFDGRYHFAIYPERFYATGSGEPPEVVQTIEDAPQAVPNYPYVFALRVTSSWLEALRRFATVSFQNDGTPAGPVFQNQSPPA
jgi:hypothetical protein